LAIDFDIAWHNPQVERLLLITLDAFVGPFSLFLINKNFIIHLEVEPLKVALDPPVVQICSMAPKARFLVPHPFNRVAVFDLLRGPRCDLTWVFRFLVSTIFG